MMKLPDIGRYYLGGKWHAADQDGCFAVVQPSNERVIGQLPFCDTQTVDEAVQAARAAFEHYSLTGKQDRLSLFDRLIRNYESRIEEMAFAISSEMGAPITMSRQAQAGVGLGLLKAFRRSLAEFDFSETNGATIIQRESIGVAGMITPWNWPMNQIVSKVGAALAAGCTMVLKPSEYAPFSAALFAEIMHASKVPHGVFNMVFGDADVGRALAAHPDVDVISITGSTRAGVDVAKTAANSVKRVTQELGGNSPYLILRGADIAAAARDCVNRLLINCGQSCNAPARLLVHELDHDRVIDAVQKVVSEVVLGDPFDAQTTLGPLVNAAQFERVCRYLRIADQEGARRVAGGNTRPSPLSSGYYVEPTVFADVTNDMVIARAEVFGPVLCIMRYSDTDEAIQIANDTDFGLTAYVYGSDDERSHAVANRLRVGMVHIDGAAAQLDSPFGGYKQSGNGRERGRWGIEEYLESKSIFRRT